MDVEQKKRREEVLLIGWELVLPELEGTITGDLDS